MMILVAGFPCARLVRSDFMRQILDCEIGWLRDTGKHTVYQKWDNTSGRIDWSRSNIIETAKRLKADACLQIDTDCAVENDFRDVISFISQDISRGYDLIIGPTVGVNGRVMIEFTDEMIKGGRPPGGKTAFEVKAGAFGFVAFTRRLMEKLEPFGYITDIDGKRYPLYMQYQTETTEDFTLCHRAREQGFRVCVDPRIHVIHYKDSPLRVGWIDDDPKVQRPGIRCGPPIQTQPPQ